MRTQELFEFMYARHDVYAKRVVGITPWTTDPILQKFRFCNVYRELDTQTMWYAKNWRKEDEFAWFPSLVFRFINWHETAEDVGYPVPWDITRFVNAVVNRKARGARVFNPAYIISTNGQRMDKGLYVAGVLNAAWHRSRHAVARAGFGLGALHHALMDIKGVGSFMAAQVVADVKYLAPYKDAADWYNFAASGPGSRRGLNRIYDNPVGKSWKEAEWHKALIDLHRPITEKIAVAGMPTLHAQDLQNCLCEFDKYERVRLGEGRPKQLYNGRT